jgi:hypothetical protein
MCVLAVCARRLVGTGVHLARSNVHPAAVRWCCCIGRATTRAHRALAGVLSVAAAGEGPLPGAPRRAAERSGHQGACVRVLLVALRGSRRCCAPGTALPGAGARCCAHPALPRAQVYNCTPAGEWQEDKGWVQQLEQGWSGEAVRDAAYAALAKVGVRAEAHVCGQHQGADAHVCGQHQGLCACTVRARR